MWIHTCIYTPIGVFVCAHWEKDAYSVCISSDWSITNGMEMSFFSLLCVVVLGKGETICLVYQLFLGLPDRSCVKSVDRLFYHWRGHLLWQRYKFTHHTRIKTLLYACMNIMCALAYKTSYSLWSEQLWFKVHIYIYKVFILFMHGMEKCSKKQEQLAVA